MKKIILLVLVFFYVTLNGSAADNDTIFSKLEAGVSAGFVAGTGFALKYFPAKKIAIQASIYGPRLNRKYDGSFEIFYGEIYSDYIASGSLYYFFSEKRNFFIYGGVQYREKKYKETECCADWSKYPVKYISKFNSGIGLGYSYEVIDGVILNFMGGYALYFHNGTYYAALPTVDFSILFRIVKNK